MFGIALFFISVHAVTAREGDVICEGTSEGLRSFPFSGDKNARYLSFKERYDKNCTHINGNLEILYLPRQSDSDKNASNDLNFLTSIREVSGYVLIVNVFIDVVPLERLLLIRGHDLFNYEGYHYSLFVMVNYHRPLESYTYSHNPPIGLSELQLPSLARILNGKVYIAHNEALCCVNTIHWSGITNGDVTMFDNVVLRKPCHNTCGKHGCWGVDKSMCQSLSRKCDSSCHDGCYGNSSSQCCDDECLAGCTGPSARDCLACKNYDNNGTCVFQCPKYYHYDPVERVLLENPDHSYALSHHCRKRCPDGYLILDKRTCVRECPPGYHKLENGNECMECDGKCPVDCSGIDPDYQYLNSHNIHTFQNCTRVLGGIKITNETFEGVKELNISPLTFDDLHVLRDVEEIAKGLVIRHVRSGLKTLAFLSRLIMLNSTLNIENTSLVQLELRSLKKITRGNVVIADNPNLCYGPDIDFTRFLTNVNQQIVVMKGNGINCKTGRSDCHEQCDEPYCWGPGDKNCLSCKHITVNGSCMANCSRELGVVLDDTMTCVLCHRQCIGGCSGPTAKDCVRCRSMKYTNECVEKCPGFMYPEQGTRLCKACNHRCIGGCTGPGEFIGEGGCKECKRSVQHGRQFKCVDYTKPCPGGFYLDVNDSTAGFVSKYLSSSQDIGRCMTCHSLCLGCTGSGPEHCIRCKRNRWNATCVDECPVDFFEDKTRNCLPCHSECRGGCSGPLPTQCVSCSNFKLPLKNGAYKFNCTRKCPDSMPFSEQEGEDNVCTDNISAKMAIIISLSVAGVGIVVIFIVVTIYRLRCRQTADDLYEVVARVTGMEEVVHVNASNAPPDLAQLRIIKEDELVKGKCIGSGSFGSVYQGKWIPEGVKVKIPVAIKILHGFSSPMKNNEFLEEARVMATVNHPCCVHVHAVCMSANMMLVSQLLPLGSLLRYLKAHKNKCNSQVLLNWCLQIAKGMAYLEKLNIVHRDLAARNVLVQSPTQVKITDFGLSKLLDYGDMEYHILEDKLPIKWLALECITDLVYTHQSDVWSFGVTVWEIFTYGKQPYGDTPMKDIAGLLRIGERLQQPPICTIDLYILMIKCWMVDPQSRPRFTDLVKQFTRMAEDPARYLVIKGDTLMRQPSAAGKRFDFIDNVDEEGYMKPILSEPAKYIQLVSSSEDILSLKDDWPSTFSGAARSLSNLGVGGDPRLKSNSSNLKSTSSDNCVFASNSGTSGYHLHGEIVATDSEQKRNVSKDISNEASTSKCITMAPTSEGCVGAPGKTIQYADIGCDDVFIQPDINASGLEETPV